MMLYAKNYAGISPVARECGRCGSTALLNKRSTFLKKVEGKVFIFYKLKKRFTILLLKVPYLISFK